MLLLTDQIGFRQPGSEVCVDVTGAMKPKRVQMIARGERLNRPEARMLQAPGENHVPVEPRPAGRDLREGHPDLEGNPRFLRENAHGTDRSQNRHHFVEQRPDRRGLAAKMVGERMPPARVRLITIGERSTARPAPPEGG